MSRFTFGILLALLAGFGLGLSYSWLISPVRVVDTEPVALRADFKDQYRAAIAAAFAANGNLPRAQARLGLLGDSDSIAALNAQAQRTVAAGGTFQQADQLVALAIALEGGTSSLVPSSSTPRETESNLDVSNEIAETQPAPDMVTPLPMQTSVPTLNALFELISQDTVCDPSLPEGLLQVTVLNSSGQQLAGVRIVVTWDAGEEQFFTGLKPELGNGYADYAMSPNVTYTLQLSLGSDIATGLIAPACRTPSGESYWGGFKLTFQQ
jgi:hypothetical protein